MITTQALLFISAEISKINLKIIEKQKMTKI
jgi:hypothetical protein